MVKIRQNSLNSGTLDLLYMLAPAYVLTTVSHLTYPSAPALQGSSRESLPSTEQGQSHGTQMEKAKWGNG